MDLLVVVFLVVLALPAAIFLYWGLRLLWARWLEGYRQIHFEEELEKQVRRDSARYRWEHRNDP